MTEALSYKAAGGAASNADPITQFEPSFIVFIGGQVLLVG